MSELVTKIEQEAGIVAIKEKSLEGVKTVADLIEKSDKHPQEFNYVSYKDRVEFLEANGYEITRKNLTNSELSVRKRK